MSRRTNTKRTKRGRGKARRTARASRIPRQISNNSGFLAPERSLARFVFDLDFTAPAATILAPWSLEAIIATNPIILLTVSTNVPGFAAMKLLYRKFRTIRTMLRFSASNQESFPIELFACMVNYLPSLVANPVAYFSQPGCKTKLISAKGGMDAGTLSVSVSPSRFGGSSSTFVEDPYTGTTDGTSPPSDNTYFIYGFNTNGQASVSGVALLVRIHMDVEFFELQSPVS